MSYHYATAVPTPPTPNPNDFLKFHIEIKHSNTRYTELGIICVNDMNFDRTHGHGGGGICGTVVALWTDSKQLEQSILH